MKTKIWLALLAVYIVWGSTYLGIRFAIESIPPFLHAGIRFLISAALILGWRFFLSRDERPTLRQWRDAGIVGLFLLVGGNGLVSWAEQTVDSGIAALIVGTTPLWLTLFEAIRPGGIRPGWMAIAGLVVGFVGIAILINPETLAGAAFRIDLWGAGALVMATILWASGSIYARSADVPKSGLMFTGMQMAVGSVGLFIVSILSNELSGFEPARCHHHFLAWAGLPDFVWLAGWLCGLWLAAAQRPDFAGCHLCLRQPTGGYVPGRLAGE
jgi:drug/metabolite transporter (DMT)-like permease